MADHYGRHGAPIFVFSHWEWLEPIRKHRSFIWVFILSAMLSSLALTYVFSEKYEGETTIFLKPIESTRLREHDTQAFGAPVPQAAYKVVGQTLDDLAKSEALLRDIVTKLNLDIPDSRDYDGLPWYTRYYKITKDFVLDYGNDAWSILKYGRVIDENPTASAVMALRKDVKIVNADSYVYLLRVRDKKQERVAHIANELAEGLVNLLRSEDQRPARTQREQLETLLAAKNEQIEEYEVRLENLLASNQIASLSQETEKDMSRYSDQELSRVYLEADIKESRALIASYAAKLQLKSNAAVSPRNEDKIQPEDFKKMSSDKLAAEVALDGQTAKYASQLQSLAKLTSRLDRLPSLQREYDLLNARLERAKRDYLLLNDALQEAIVKETSAQTELLIQNEAHTPDGPETPIKIYHVGLATGLGALLAIGMAFVLGYFNIRVFMPSKGYKARGKSQPLPASPAGAPAGSAAE